MALVTKHPTVFERYFPTFALSYSFIHVPGTGRDYLAASFTLILRPLEHLEPNLPNRFHPRQLTNLLRRKLQSLLGVLEDSDCFPVVADLNENSGA